ncbi:hypothetical protein H4696_004188 [Amycolatopsis lexingtonensis]|uniref:Uncharacterized protein n=1 Tax=Amycolatopsis lexingtonensis TaxID=218822 RepID=A0ABR9I1R4_9PSEU|nr:hypothetical protein [Amycolatopsis lexingtonensis]
MDLQQHRRAGHRRSGPVDVQQEALAAWGVSDVAIHPDVRGAHPERQRQLAPRQAEVGAAQLGRVVLAERRSQRALDLVAGAVAGADQRAQAGGRRRGHGQARLRRAVTHAVAGQVDRGVGRGQGQQLGRQLAGQPPGEEHRDGRRAGPQRAERVRRQAELDRTADQEVRLHQRDDTGE